MTDTVSPAPTQAQAGHGGNTGLLLLAAGVVAFGAYELMKGGKPAATTQEPGAGPDATKPGPPPADTRVTAPSNCLRTPGTFVQSFGRPGGEAIYIVDNAGALRHIASPEALKACGYDLSAGSIYQMSWGEISGCPTGPDIPGPPCPPACKAGQQGEFLLVTDVAGGAIYIVDNGGSLRHITADAMASCGYKLTPSNSREVTLAELAGCNVARELTGPPDCEWARS